MNYKKEHQAPLIVRKLFVGVFIILATGNVSIAYGQHKIDLVTTKGNVSNGEQEDFSESPLRLEAMLTFAESHSPELQSAYRKWKAAKEKAPQAKSLPDPRISYGYFTEEVQTRTGPQEHKFGISQTIPWLGKLTLKEKIALKEADAVYQNYVNTHLRLMQRIKTIFYEYAYLAQAVKISVEHLNILKAMEQVATSRFKSGTLPQSTLIQVQVEQGKIEDRIKELETLRVPLSSRLYASVGLKSSDLLPWPETLQNEIAEFDEQTLNSVMLEYNPSLIQTELLREKENYAVKLADKEFYPDVTLGLEHINVDGGDDPMVAMISINLPIWWSRLNAAKREAFERRESISDTLTDQENQLSAQLDLVLYYFRDAQRKARLYMNTLIPKAQQAIDVALKGFETGKVNFADLLDAERSLLEFQLTEKRQAANSYIRLAEIEALIGKELQSKQ